MIKFHKWLRRYNHSQLRSLLIILKRKSSGMTANSCSFLTTASKMIKTNFLKPSRPQFKTATWFRWIQRFWRISLLGLSCRPRVVCLLPRWILSIIGDSRSKNSFLNWNRIRVFLTVEDLKMQMKHQKLWWNKWRPQLPIWNISLYWAKSIRSLRASRVASAPWARSSARVAVEAKEVNHLHRCSTVVLLQ